MKSFSKFTLASAIMALAFVSCKTDDDNSNPDTPPNEPELIKVGSAPTDVGGMVVNLFAEDSLLARYTPLFIEVRDQASDDVITTATIDLNPMMDMGMMQHSAPSENPEDETAIDGMFAAAVVFTMPSDTGWTLEVEVFDPVGDRIGTAPVPLTVGAPSSVRVLNETPLDGSNSLVIALVEPLRPQVGQNDFEITLHRRVSSMEFPAAENLSASIDPQMPSMGHGSPNNIDPTHLGDGHYNGTVNFTMTGTWVVNIDIYDGNTALDTTASFEISF